MESTRASHGKKVRLLIAAMAATTFVGVHASLASAAPLRSISRYVQSTDTNRWDTLGCDLGVAVTNGTRPRDAVVVLDFGDPDNNGSRYGVNLPGAPGFIDFFTVRGIAQAYGNGYYRCSPLNTQLTIAMGTNNHGSWVNSSHGSGWGTMVNNTNSNFSSSGISSQVTAVGASDLELDWNTSTTTKNWVNGYSSTAAWPYYDYGDAAGCPPAGNCDNGWHQSDVQYVSWGATAAWPLPEDYNEAGTQAQQWYQISLWSYNNAATSLGFVGTMAQWQACADQHVSCSGTDNTADQAWSLLQNAINGDSRTATSIKWSTDISWAN